MNDLPLEMQESLKQESKGEYSHSKRVKCPHCGSIFENERIDEAGPTTNVENQAHEKALVHIRDEHSDWLEENRGFKGLIPVPVEDNEEKSVNEVPTVSELQ